MKHKDMISNLRRIGADLLKVVLCANVLAANAQHTDHQVAKPLTEDDFYKITTIPIPANTALEVGGLARLPNGSMAVSTRQGEIWILDNPSNVKSSQARFRLFASGLHEPLGLAYKDGSFYAAQRAELTKITDTDKDGVADLFETVATWPLSGNYCEYSHGPIIGDDGNFYINLNLGDNGMGRGAEPFFGEMGSHALWRGWMIQVTPEGKVTPIAAGFRSPAGIGRNAKGDLFYTENQGGWVGTGYISKVDRNDFFGHPSSLKSAAAPGSSLKVRVSDIPKDNPLFHDVIQRIPDMKMPSVRLPHGILGISLAGFAEDNTAGGFGPFQGQYFIGDEGHANVMRVFMEEVNGAYQGAAFPFRQGFMSGILRMEWGSNNQLFVGMSDRGWNSQAPNRYGLQVLEWTGKMPFEMQTIKAKPDGFEIAFTSPVDKSSAANPESYHITGFDYRYHQAYGSEVYDKKDCKIKAIQISGDGLTVRLVVDGLREGYIHEIKCADLKSESNLNLLHNVGYYSLNAIPSGQALSMQDKNVVKINPTKDLTEKSESNVAETTDKYSGTQPASWKNGPDQTFVISTRPGLKFEPEKMDMKPGARVKLTFNNNDDMQHNLVIVKPNAADEVGKLALNLGLDGPAAFYIPDSEKVLVHTGLLQPRSSETIYFTAPREEGIYPFICTYPGHYTIMRGELKVGR